MRIYAMSDIHGCLGAFDKALGTIDMKNPENTLVLLGDYIDRGPDGFGVVKRVMELEAAGKAGAGCKVVALRGNHEDMFLEMMDSSDDEAFAVEWLQLDRELRTAASFLGEEKMHEVRHLLYRRRVGEAFSLYAAAVKESCGEALEWMRRLPYYFETDRQIFAHAGVREDAVFEDGTVYWKVATSDLDYTTIGCREYAGNEFVKDVVVGHTTTDRASGIEGYRGIWHDGASHYFIDGNVVANGELAVLCYDTETGVYSGPGIDS